MHVGRCRYNGSMRVMTLQSGSNGNSIFVEAGGVRLLVDAGISGVRMQSRLTAQGIDPRDVDALLISHDHSDHVRCMGVYQRKFGIPVYVTERTLMAARLRNRLGVIDDVRCFTSGAYLEFGTLRVETVRTPHDGVDGVGFVFDDGECRLGVLTDLGHVFAGLEETLQSLDAVLLESNYDPRMLEQGPYPELLKRRIRGPGGHLSNHESARLLSDAFRRRLKWALLAHLSQQNNDPALALQTHQEIVGPTFPLNVASRYAASPLFEL